MKLSIDLDTLLKAAVSEGMAPAVWARIHGDRTAIVDPDGKTHSFAKVNANANRLARLFRTSGLKAGDAVALICSNRAEFVEVLNATARTGLRITPVNWHLTSDEIAYIVRDCQAKAVIAEARVPGIGNTIEECFDVTVKLAVGASLEGFLPYEHALASFDGSDIGDPVLGSQMAYTSGTTGRPKGVYRPIPVVVQLEALRDRGYDPATSVQLCAGPAYHAAPLSFDVKAAQTAGVPLVFLDKWNSELVLRTIWERRITHMHLVPIMFQRLLALPDEIKGKYPIDHVRFIIHGAAPCPPEVKHAMIDWFGPVLTEYYAGSEGGGLTINSEDWLRKPGSVGQRPDPAKLRIFDDEGHDVPQGQPGTIYFQLPPGGFRYFGDPQKTSASRIGDYFTMGDVGFLDQDDYLFLTGRSAETIISGGVNIYPQEIDNELIKHDAVADSATVGIPHDEWGEQVKAVILLKPGYEPSDALALEILDHARAALPGFKVPRSLDFVTTLPRSEAGKVQRNKVRAPYWKGRERQI